MAQTNTETQTNDSAIRKLRLFCQKIARPETDLEELFTKYRLHLIDKKDVRCYMVVRVIQRWLYDIRVKNSNISGLMFIDVVLYYLQREMRKDLNDAQQELLKETCYLYLRERSVYSVRKFSRGY